jgi:hypothetical protein
LLHLSNVFFGAVLPILNRERASDRRKNDQADGHRHHQLD